MLRHYEKLIILALSILIFSANAVFAQKPSVQVTFLITDSLKSTTRTLHGVRKVIKKNFPETAFNTLMISRPDIADTDLVDSIKKSMPTLILTVGSSATGFAKDNFPEIPIVFSSVKYPVLSGFVQSIEKPGGSITGASLNIPDDIQFKYFKKIIPNLKNIGVIYTENTAPLIAQAEIVAKQMNMKLMPVLINENKDLPIALDSLSTIADGIWSVADPVLFNSKSTKYIIMNTLRRQIPFMGFSRNVVESGALFSLDFDYKAVGFQAGEIAIRIINGEKPANIKVSTSDLIWFHYNEKTANHIRITVPDELVAVAKEVYR